MAKTGSQAVRRALGLLACFTDEHPRLTLTQISERSDLTYPTVSRMVNALIDYEFLAQDPQDSTYSVGPEIMRLARIILKSSEQSELLAFAMPQLEIIRSTTGETVGFHVPMGSKRVCIAELTSRHPVRMETGIGVPYPLYAGAVGKAILARLPEARRENCIGEADLVPLTSNTITSREKLLQELAAVRDNGYATSFGETVVEASAMAAPILGSDGFAIAAINITGPAARWDQEKMQATVPLLLDIVSQLSSHLGYSM